MKKIMGLFACLSLLSMNALAGLSQKDRNHLEKYITNPDKLNTKIFSWLVRDSLFVFNIMRVHRKKGKQYSPKKSQKKFIEERRPFLIRRAAHRLEVALGQNFVQTEEELSKHTPKDLKGEKLKDFQQLKAAVENMRKDSEMKAARDLYLKEKKRGDWDKNYRKHFIQERLTILAVLGVDVTDVVKFKENASSVKKAVGDIVGVWKWGDKHIEKFLDKYGSDLTYVPIIGQVIGICIILRKWRDKGWAFIKKQNIHGGVKAMFD